MVRSTTSSSGDMDYYLDLDKGDDSDSQNHGTGDTAGTRDPVPMEAGGAKRVSVVSPLGRRLRLARRTAKVAVPRVACTSSGKRGMVDEKMQDEAHVRRYYTCGVRDTVLGSMILVPVLFWLILPRLSLPEISTHDHPIAVVWRVSLSACVQFFFLIILTTQQTTMMSIFRTLFRLSYAPLVAFVATHFFSPVTGMGIVHLSTAWAAGVFGYSFSQYRQRIGTEQAASVALTLTPTGVSKRMVRQRMDLLVQSVFFCGLFTLWVAALVLWLVFWPTYEDVYFSVGAVSVLIFWMLYVWSFVVIKLSLHEAFISLDSMMRISFCYLASNVGSVVCFLHSEALWSYFFGLQMMIMSGFMGYILAIRSQYHEMLLSLPRKKGGSCNINK